MIFNIQVGLSGRRRQDADGVGNITCCHPPHIMDSKLSRWGLAVDVFSHAPATSNKVDLVGMASIRGADNLPMLTSSAQVVRLDRSP